MKGCRARHVFATCWLITVRWGAVLPEAFGASPTDPAHEGCPKPLLSAAHPSLHQRPWTPLHLRGNPLMTSKMLCVVVGYTSRIPCAGIAPHRAHLTHWASVRRSMFPCGPRLPGRRSFVLDQRDVYNLWLSSPKTPSFPLLNHTERALLKSARHCGVCLPAEGA